MESRFQVFSSPSRFFDFDFAIFICIFWHSDYLGFDLAVESRGFYIMALKFSSECTQLIPKSLVAFDRATGKALSSFYMLCPRLHYTNRHLSVFLIVMECLACPPGRKQWRRHSIWLIWFFYEAVPAM